MSTSDTPAEKTPEVLDLPARIRQKIVVAGDCWLWNASTVKEGYGRVQHKGKWYLAHRAVYELLVGEIGSFTLDHLCRNRACVNPKHLEPVTLRENILRGTGVAAQCAKKEKCLYGHEFETITTGTGRIRRICRTCEQLRARKWYLANRQLAINRSRERRKAFRDSRKVGRGIVQGAVGVRAGSKGKHQPTVQK